MPIFRAIGRGLPVERCGVRECLVRQCEGAMEARAHAMSFGTQAWLGHVPVHAKFEGHKMKLKAV